MVQVPGIAALIQGVTYEKGGVTPHYMGVENKNGRLMVFITRNCDLGDAWEWINDSRYPAQFGVVAYKVGMNVITYAMSHYVRCVIDMAVCQSEECSNRAPIVIHNC